MAKQENNIQEEPWVFCERCYSIRFKYEDSLGMECCEDCGCTDFKSSTFEDWEKLYKNRYGHPYLEDCNSIKKSTVFLLSDEQLKTKLFKSSACKEICRKLYTGFPGGLSNEDSVLLLFSKLYRDNRLDALRLELAYRDKNQQ